MSLTTKGPMWGYLRPVLGAVDPLLEPFRGHLSPKTDKVCEKNDFEIPPRRALRGTGQVVLSCLGSGDRTKIGVTCDLAEEAVYFDAPVAKIRQARPHPVPG